MLERLLPITDTTIGLGLSVRSCALLLQYHGWPDTYPAMARMVAARHGIAKAPSPGRAKHGAVGSLLRVNPQRLWLLSERFDARDQAALEPQIGVALDLSHARAIIRIAGDIAETLLSRFIAIDLRPHRFAIDDVAIVPLHRISVVLWRRAEGVDVLAPRSFARSIWEALAEVAERLG
jgi:heterotetrameric sarcosine oxidase gamma subunit